MRDPWGQRDRPSGPPIGDGAGGSRPAGGLGLILLGVPVWALILGYVLW
jgi:hypothetical protein